MNFFDECGWASTNWCKKAWSSFTQDLTGAEFATANYLLNVFQLFYDHRCTVIIVHKVVKNGKWNITSFVIVNFKILTSYNVAVNNSKLGIFPGINALPDQHFPIKLWPRQVKVTTDARCAFPDRITPFQRLHTSFSRVKKTIFPLQS